MSDTDSMPDDAPGTEVPPQVEERDEKRGDRPRDDGPDLSDLNDVIAPDSLSGPVRPERD